MRKIIMLLLAILSITFITACSKEDKITPQKAFDTYIENWHNQDFQKMFQMLSKESLSKYPAVEFIDRYEKVYEDLKVEQLKITYTALTKDEEKQSMAAGEAIIPFQVEMESIAGPITFNYEAVLTQYGGEDEDHNWFVEWDPGFIFPAMKDGGTINIETTIPARGEILDRNDMPLALNDFVYEIGIVPEKLGDHGEATKRRIGQLLHLSVEAIDAKLNENWVKPNLFVPIKKVPKTDDHIINELHALEGIMSREVTGRVYPSGEAAAHLIGYIGQITEEELKKKDTNVYGSNDMIGKRGLEQIYEEQLKGSKGVQITIVNDNEEVLLAEIPAKNGENIVLTIDANIQDKVFEAYGGLAGTATMLDPKTGETLALVSSPSFNPNEMLYGITQKRWDQLNNDPQMPLLNRFAATYAPGSVIKPITAAIGLENGVITPDEGIEINGLTWGNGKGWGDYKVKRVSTSSKPVDLADALIRSDNIYFAMKAVEMGADAYIKGLKSYGLGEKIPFEYPLTKSTISSDGKLSGEVEVANTSYGQAEVEFSALHLAATYTTFLNEGNMIKPTLLLNEKKGQVWKKELLTPEQSVLMQDILRDIVTKGTAKVVNFDDFPISGKTGTAELKHSHDSKGHENGWFIGYPTDQQDVLMALMIEHAEDIGTSGLAAQKVAEVFLEMNQK